MHPYERRFLELLAQDRYDVATRLLYADWLSSECARDSESAIQRRMATAEWCASARWMESKAAECGHSYDIESDDYVEITYDVLIQAGMDYLAKGEYYIQRGSQTMQSLFWEDETAKEYWHHWQVITGVGVSLDDELDAPFSCSC